MSPSPRAPLSPEQAPTPAGGSPRSAGRRVALGAAALVVLLVGAWLLVGRGSGGGTEAGGPTDDPRSTWEGVFDAALDALARQDRAALDALLTPEGRLALEQDLARFAVGLSLPEVKGKLVEDIRRLWPEVPDSLLAAAKGGDLGAAWTLFMRAAVPPGVTPERAGVRVDPAGRAAVEALYRYGSGPERPIRLERLRGGWSVTYVSLGGR